ncbi:MAG: urate hydroxylase PuuD [Candidatus Eisenbacteria bacterium]
MEHVLDWLAFLLRWGHVLIGVVWIGASFYLISWENKFNRTRNLREGVEGDFWTIQGGDFYYVEKLRKAPIPLPAELHWFKYEAYWTWISGFALLCTVFYMHADTMLVGPDSWLPPGAGVALGIGSLALSWWAYDLYCRTRIARNLALTACVGLVFVALASYAFSQVFGPRAAFMHVGAVLGTFMSGNVFFGIIPWHRRLIRAIEANQPVDALYAQRPGFRSRHNHYLTFPVFFIMLMGHFPAMLDHPQGWALLPAAALGAGLIKHAHTRIQRKQSWHGYLLGGVGVFAGLIAVTGWNTGSACPEPVPTARAFEVITRRCASCHSAAPTDRIWRAPPNGVTFDTPEEVEALRERIVERAVRTRTMPPEGRAGVTPGERTLLACWAAQHRRASAP